jgi:hypothetical protein
VGILIGGRDDWDHRALGRACVGSLQNSVGWVASFLYAFYIRIRMNISEGPPMHDSSTIAANLSVAVVGKPTWPLISDIESIFSVASYYRN